MTANRIYISGPMTGKPDYNRAAFNIVAQRLRALNLYAMNPVELNAHLKEPTWHACLRNDIKALVDCNVLVLLPGWEESAGARLEVHIAKQLGIWVFEASAFLKIWEQQKEAA